MAAIKYLVRGTLRVAELPGWYTFQQAADRIGVSRQRVHDMVFTMHDFDVTDLCYVDLAHQPLHLIRDTAVNAEVARREAAASR